MKLGALASELGAELVPGAAGRSAPAETEVSGVSGIETAGPAHVTFVHNPKYASFALSTAAAAVIVSPDFVPLPVTTLRVDNPYHAFARAMRILHPPQRYAPGIHSTAVIDPTARLGERAHVGAYVVVSEGCLLGDDAVLLPHVVLYPGVQTGHRFFAHAHAVVREHCRLGDDVELQNGAVVGADGFGFAKDANGRWLKILQVAPVVLEDSVEVQANACVDRASVGETRIKRGTKIDNLVQVGHGCTVGEDTLLCAQVGLAGSTVVGNRVILAGQVGAAGHLTIGDGAVATAQTGIPNDVPAGATVSGTPAVDTRLWLRSSAALKRLPDALARLRVKPEANS